MTLPLLLSVPHAGTAVPREVAGRCALTHDEVVADGDEGAGEIYDLADHVVRLVTTPVARAVVDMNRAEDDRRRDGVIKTHTCWDVPVWRTPLTDAECESLLDRYHRPYHEALARPDDGVVLGVDCHTMAAHGPPVGPDPGIERPAACLSHADGTCPDAWIHDMAALLERHLGRPVTINEPFRGGYITRHHAAERPWMQLELSRAPYLSPGAKRQAVLATLREWCSTR